MQRILPLVLVSAVVALGGCGNTWQGAKSDTKHNADTVTNAVGTGLDKAGDGLNKAGEKVKEVGK
ncbi:MAG: entericidin EcnAB [Ottowia sp.]|jgi:predicted small secreted protein|nr:entericidin EcnAB [Ottowia sp.]